MRDSGTILLRESTATHARGPSDLLGAREGRKTALIYARVSTRRQKLEGTGLDSQVAACIAHAEGLGYKVGRVTREVFSGAVLFDRPELSRDRGDICAGRFDAIIVHSIDRLSRDEAHLAIITGECEEAGCRLVSVTEESTSAPDPEPSRSEDIFYAETERRKISERTRRGRLTRLRQGKPSFGGSELYGYRADRASGTYKIEESEAEIVRRIFSLCASGRGMHSIASLLNREGLPSPKSAVRPGARWSSSGISRLLNTRSYIGEEYRMKTRRGSGKRDLPRPESEWLRLPDGIRPPIITRELWDASHRNIHANARRMKNKGERPSLLRGHIFCGACGARMIRNHFRRGKYEYEKYRCGSRWRPFDTGCRGEGVTAPAIHEWVLGEVASTLHNLSTTRQVVAETGPSAELTHNLRITKRALERTDGELKDLLSRPRASVSADPLPLYLDRELRQVLRKKQRLESMVAEIEGRIEEANRPVADLLYLKDSVLGRKNPGEFTFDEQRMALRALAVKVYANGDDGARWRYEVKVPVW